MPKNLSLKAITLVEMLIVMAISAGGFFGVVESMRQISYARLASNAAKASVNLVRTTKHQAMLLRLLPDETWIYGMGIRIHKVGSSYWLIERVKYKSIVSEATFGTSYKKYPTEVPPRIDAIEPVAKDTTYQLTEKLILEPRIKLYIFNAAGELLTDNDIFDDFYIIFESLTGTPHYYKKEGNASRLSAIDPKGALLLLFYPSSSVLYIGSNADIYLAPKATFNNLKISK